jgi:hypothetical protein
MMEDLSATVGNALAGAGSMLPTSGVTQAPPFQPPGSEGESVLDSDVRPRPKPVPPVSAHFIAGVGDKGGVLVGTGDDPGAGGSWASVGSLPDVSLWTTRRDPHYRDDRQQ